MTGPSSLAEMIEAAAAEREAETPLSSAQGVAITSCRIPRAVLGELARLTRDNGMSVSLLINLLIDAHLRGQGRPGYEELAPWYPHYVLRRGQSTRQ